MTRFPPGPSCTELPADLGRLPASVCKPFAAGMYKQAVKIGFGRDIQDGSHRKNNAPHLHRRLGVRRGRRVVG